jgi:hypothetical protein
MELLPNRSISTHLPAFWGCFHFYQGFALAFESFDLNSRVFFNLLILIPSIINLLFFLLFFLGMQTQR